MTVPFTEDFSSGRVESSRWEISHGGSIVGNRLFLPANSSYPAVWSVPVPFRGSYVFAEIEVLDTQPGIEYQFNIRTADYGTARFLVNNGNLSCGTAGIDGVYTYPVSLTYDPVAHRWLKFSSDDQGTITWYSSPDARDWTERHSQTVDPAMIERVVIQFIAGEWVGTTTGGMYVDSINVLPMLPISKALGFYFGDSPAATVYLGDTKVWPFRPPAQPPYITTEEDGVLLVWHMPYDLFGDIPPNWTSFDIAAPEDLMTQIATLTSSEHLLGQGVEPGFDPDLPSRVRLHAMDGPWVNVFSGDGTTRLVWGEVMNALGTQATDPFVYRRVGDHIVMDSLSRTVP